MPHRPSQGFGSVHDRVKWESWMDETGDVSEALSARPWSQKQKAVIIAHFGTEEPVVQKRKVRHVGRAVIYAEFHANPNVKRARTKRFDFIRDSKSREHKVDRKTGRFVKFNRKEREVRRRSPVGKRV